MTRINFDLPMSDYLELQHILGERNISKTFRELAQQMIENSDKNDLQRLSQELEKQISILNEKKIIIDFKLKNIFEKEQEVKNKEIEDKIKETEAESIKYSYDPLAHLSGKSKIRDAQILSYRIEKGKFLPEWAKEKEPSNPKQYALDILNNIIKKEKDKEVTND